MLVFDNERIAKHIYILNNIFCSKYFSYVNFGARQLSFLSFSFFFSGQPRRAMGAAAYVAKIRIICLIE
jgi:hypothetical protein